MLDLINKKGEPSKLENNSQKRLLIPYSPTTTSSPEHNQPFSLNLSSLNVDILLHLPVSNTRAKVSPLFPLKLEEGFRA